MRGFGGGFNMFEVKFRNSSISSYEKYLARLWLIDLLKSSGTFIQEHLITFWSTNNWWAGKISVGIYFSHHHTRLIEIATNCMTNKVKIEISAKFSLWVVDCQLCFTMYLCFEIRSAHYSCKESKKRQSTMINK